MPSTPDLGSVETPVLARELLKREGIHDTLRAGLTTLAEGSREREKKTLAGSGAPNDPQGSQQAPNLALLSAEARRSGEAGEIFSQGGFFGAEASRLTYGIETPADQVPPITFPAAFLEKCKTAGGQLRLHADKAPDNKPLNMLAMHRLVAERWAREGNGKLLLDEGGWKAREPFFTKGTPRQGWRVVFPDIVAGTTSEDDLRQTELLIAELTRLFQGTSMPKVYEDAIREFEARKAGTRTLMKSDRDWPKASEAIEGFGISRVARPIPSELLDIIAVNRDHVNQWSFPDVYSRTPVRSSLGGLVGVGSAGLDGAGVDGNHPGFADPPLGASLSLQSWPI